MSINRPDLFIPVRTGRRKVSEDHFVNLVALTTYINPMSGIFDTMALEVEILCIRSITTDSYDRSAVIGLSRLGDLTTAS